MKKIFFCKLSQLDEKKYFVKWINEFKDEIIVFRGNGKIYAKSSVCPHFGGPIAYDQEKNYLYCYWHGLKFSTDGKCLNSKKFKGSLSKYNNEIKNNFIYIYKNENT